jgi:hypothetical protein
MTEMVERMARAMAAANLFGWEALLDVPYSMFDDPRTSRRYWLDLARTALEAMREPTYVMAMNGGCELDDSENLSPTEMAEDAGKVWSTMIAYAVSDSGSHPKGENGVAG